MSTTATDATLEELQALCEIEEAGYRLVMGHRRQTYTSGIPAEPWQECWRVQAAELRSGLPEIPQTFDTKAEALAAALVVIAKLRAAGRELFGFVSDETRNAINEAIAKRAGFSMLPGPAGGCWQLTRGGEQIGPFLASSGALWQLAVDIASREQRGEDDPFLEVAARARKDRELDKRLHQAAIPAGSAGLSLEDIAVEGQANTRALAALREYVKNCSVEKPQHLIVAGAAATRLAEVRAQVKDAETGAWRACVTRPAAGGSSITVASALTRELCEAGVHAYYTDVNELRRHPGWKLAEGVLPAQLITPDVVVVDLVGAADNGGGCPARDLVRARDRAGQSVVLVVNEAREEAEEALEVDYLRRWGAQVINFSAAEQKTAPGKSLQKHGVSGGRK